MVQKPGQLVTFEGPDGCGKSTLVPAVYANLKDQLSCLPATNPSPQPMGTLLKEQLRANAMTPQAALLLFLADRYEHFHTVVKPQLESGTWVLMDRFTDSSVVYQSVHCGVSMEALAEWIHQFQWFPIPKRTYVLDLDYETMRDRLKARQSGIQANDQAGYDFYKTILDRYKTLAKKHPKRIVLLDGGKSVEDLSQQVCQELVALAHAS